MENRIEQNKTNWPKVKEQQATVSGLITTALGRAANYIGDKEDLTKKINALKTELEAIIVDTLYAHGQLENDSLDKATQWQKDILDIKNRLNDLLGETLDADNYDQLVNDHELMTELEKKALATRGVYNEAVALDDTYQMLRSKTLRDAVAAAKAASDAYNQALKAYPAKINEAYDDAATSIADYRADEDTRKEFYPEDQFKGDTAVFNTLISEMETLSAGYKATADAAIGTSATTFLAAVSATLADSTYFFTKYAAYDTTSTNAKMVAYKGFIAKLADKKATLVKKIADLDKSNNGIKDLDDILYDLENWKESTTNEAGVSYADKNADKLKEAAVQDLTVGKNQAVEAIKKGNQFYYGQETTPTDETKLNEAWEAKKLPIEGKAATATTEKIPGVADSIATIKPANHEAKYDSISAILDTFLEDTEILIESEDAYNRWNAALGAANAAGNAKGSLQAQLNKAKDDAKNYVVIDDMVNNGGFKTIQDVIDQKRADVEALRKAGICTFTAEDSLDSVKISREIQIVSKLVKDTLKTDSDVYLPNIVEANTLFRKEQAYLEGLEDQLWALFNQAAANKWNETDEEVRVEKGQEFEAELQDIYYDLDSIVTEVNADPKKADAAKLLALQNRIDVLTKGMVAAAGDLGDNTQATIETELKAALQAVQDKLEAAAALDKSGLTADQLSAINTEKNNLQTAITATKNAIEAAKAADNLPLKEGQFEDQIEALDKKVDALTQKINELNEQNDALAANYAAADATLKTLDAALEKLEEAFEKFDNIDEDDYANRLALVDKRAGEIKDGVQDAKDENKAVDNTKLTQAVNTLVADINALINAAAKDDLEKHVDELEGKVEDIDDDLTYLGKEFLASDLKAMRDTLTNLKKALVGADETVVGGLKKKVNDLGDNTNIYDSQYAALKKEADSIEVRLDSLAEKMEILLNGGEIPVVTIPGDIDGDGFVTSDDVEAFLDKLQNDLLPDEDDDDFDIYDVNGDDELNIADAQGILNLSLGLNWDGTEVDDDDDAMGARSMEAPAGNITAETQQLENGAQRITLNLSSNFDWTGFQMDVKGAEVLAENAQGMSLRTADLKNGAHRIVAFGAAQGNGRVITLDVQGNAQLGTITFTTSNAQAVSFKLSGTTGIYSVATDKSNTIYDLGGKLLNGMKKGVNIIRDAAGKAKKAIMK
jgi:DNA repair exonuclease SbcCD ATPase subunit